MEWDWLAVGFDYQRRYIKKKNGKLRAIDVPRPWLKTIQQELVKVITDAVPGHSAATGFLPHRSPALHARYHAGAEQAVVVDIRNFFGSVHPRHIRSLLQEGDWQLTPPQRVPVLRQFQRSLFNGEDLVPENVLCGWEKQPFEGWSDEGKLWVERILFRQDPVTFVRHLAQGAPSSPVVSNLAAYPMDCWIEHQIECVMKVPCSYSRYADDLVISSQFRSQDFNKQARAILETALQRFGWKAHPQKTRFWDARSGGVLTLCGVNVPSWSGGTLTLPKSIRRRVRALLHRSGWASPFSADRPPRALTQMEIGLLSYVWSINADERLLPLVSPKIREKLLAWAGELSAAGNVGLDDPNVFIRAWVSALKTEDLGSGVDPCEGVREEDVYVLDSLMDYLLS
jgi:hypothetical protein